jgi:hypothetical protein
MASIWKTEKYTAKNGKIYQRYALDASGNKQLKDHIDPNMIDQEILTSAKKAPRVPRIPQEPVEEYKLIDLSNEPVEKLIASDIYPGLVFRMRRSETNEYLGYRVVEKMSTLGTPSLAP